MIALVDCNNFFVSCEKIFAPALEGRPVAVLTNNDGVVIARSPELKALGVPMGEPYFKLKPLAPLYGILFRSSNYELYADISRRVMSVLHDFSPVVEQYSIDEAFLQIRLPAGGDYLEFGRGLRQRILQWIGMPVGVGIAPTRTLAKIANHAAKKSASGVLYLEKPEEALLSGTPIEDVWGVGHRLGGKLRGIGIRDAAALAAMPQEECLRRFNICLARTIAELNGQSAIGYDGFGSPTQTASCSRSFGTPVDTLAALRESVISYAGMVAEKLRSNGKKAQGATLFLQTCQDYAPVARPSSVAVRGIAFRRPTANTSEILAQVLPLLPSMFEDGRRYRKSGVTCWGLDGLPAEQPDFFLPAPEPAVPDRLYSVLDQINHAYGRGSIHPLAEGTEHPWQMRRDMLTQRYTTRWEDLPLVR